MINKKLLKKDIPRVIISLFVISLGLSIGCMFYNKFVLRRQKVVEGLTPAGSIVEDAKQQELEDLELYPKRVTDVDDIPIVELPPQPTNVEVPTGDDSTDSKDVGSYTAAIPSEGETKELCNGIIGGKYFGPGGYDMSDKQTIAPGCSETAWCCRPIGPILRYQADSPGWKNAWGTTCKQYAEKFCKDCKFRSGGKETGGEKHSY